MKSILARSLMTTRQGDRIMMNTPSSDDRLAIRHLAYELNDAEIALVSGGDEKPPDCHWKATTTDSNGDRTNDDCDV